MENVLDKKTVEYIKSTKSAGISNGDIKNTLLNKQIDGQEIDSFLQTENNPQKPAGNDSMWDAFEHFLLFLSMLIFVVSIGLLLHYFIDKWTSQGSVDLNQVYKDSFSSMLVDGYLASIIVSLPFFTFFFLKITRKTIAHPELRNLRSRKVLTYITLVLTFIIMIWNIIGLVFNFLRGNVGLNFASHFLLTFLINGIVFSYYLYQVKEDRNLGV